MSVLSARNVRQQTRRSQTTASQHGVVPIRRERSCATCAHKWNSGGHGQRESLVQRSSNILFKNAVTLSLHEIPTRNASQSTKCVATTHKRNQDAPSHSTFEPSFAHHCPPRCFYTRPCALNCSFPLCAPPWAYFGGASAASGTASAAAGAASLVAAGTEAASSAAAGAGAAVSTAAAGGAGGVSWWSGGGAAASVAAGGVASGAVSCAAGAEAGAGASSCLASSAALSPVAGRASGAAPGSPAVAGGDGAGSAAAFPCTSSLGGGVAVGGASCAAGAGSSLKGFASVIDVTLACESPASSAPVAGRAAELGGDGAF